MIEVYLHPTVQHNIKLDVGNISREIPQCHTVPSTNTQHNFVTPKSPKSLLNSFVNYKFNRRNVIRQDSGGDSSYLITRDVDKANLENYVWAGEGSDISL